MEMIVHGFHMSGDSDNTSWNGQLHFTIRVIMLEGDDGGDTMQLMWPMPHTLPHICGMALVSRCFRRFQTRRFVAMLGCLGLSLVIFG